MLCPPQPSGPQGILHSPHGAAWGNMQGGPSKGSALRQGAQGRPTSGTSHPGPPALLPPSLLAYVPQARQSLESWSARRDSGVATEGREGLCGALDKCSVADEDTESLFFSSTASRHVAPKLMVTLPPAREEPTSRSQNSSSGARPPLAAGLGDKKSLAAHTSCRHKSLDQTLESWHPRGLMIQSTARAGCLPDTPPEAPHQDQKG